MNVFLTVYNTPIWESLINASGISGTDNTHALEKKICALLPPQTLSMLPTLLEQQQNIQQIWVAVVQAEYFIADAIEKGQSLVNAAHEWKQLTNDLLHYQSKHRKKIKLFNLHQALMKPTLFCEHIGGANIREYPAQSFDCSFTLLAASQYIAQQAEIKSLNTLLQASALPLCESEYLILDIDSTIQQNRSLSSELLTTKFQRDQALDQLHNTHEELETNKNVHTRQLSETTGERDLILSQLHQVQEELERYFHALRSEKETNKTIQQECKAKEQLHKHTQLASDKQNSKEIAKLESELRKNKARAASAEFAGQLLQQELSTLKESISWKTAKPIRMIGRLVKKTDKEREALLQQIGLLLTSEYFDVDWYLRNYTDVAESKMNPAEHYLLFGAKEGRLPSPFFDGNWYLQHYPDVAAADINPLLHFIMYGQQEGRTSSPKLLTNNQNAKE